MNGDNAANQADRREETKTPERIGYYARLLLECLGTERLEREQAEELSPYIERGIQLVMSGKIDNDHLLCLIQKAERWEREDSLLARIVYDLNEDKEERWDGKGRPYGKKGRGLSFLSRMAAVAEQFAWLCEGENSQEEVCDALRKERGGRLDPELVDTVLEYRDHFFEKRQELGRREQRAGKK